MTSPKGNSEFCFRETLNIISGNSVEPLNDLIVKPVTTYNFRKSLNVEVFRPRTAVGRSSFQHRVALT